MNDLLMSLVVIALTGACIGGLFYFLHLRKAHQQAELARFCQQQGITLQAEHQRLRHRLSFQRDNWQIVAQTEARVNTADTGSSEWSSSTTWTAPSPGTGLPSFALGSCPSAEKFDLVPAWMQETIIAKLRCDLKLDAAFAPTYFPRAIGQMSFLLFAADQSTAAALYTRLEPVLAQWPPAIPLTIMVSAETVRIQLLTHYLQEIPLLQKLIALGESCLGPQP